MHAYRDQYATLFHDGRNIVLIAISVDSAGALASWAHDDEFPFLMVSDTGGAIGKRYGARLERYNVDSRALFVIDPGGRIAWRTPDFKEIDPTAYTELAGVLNRVAGAGADSTHTH